MPLRVPRPYWIVLGVLLVAPGAATAQTSGDPQPGVSQAADPASAPLVKRPMPKLKADPKPTPQFGFPPREPTMGAYIEDASVISKIRIRFDSAFGTNVPDRAEFFYAKCGCYQLDLPPYHDPDAPGPGPGVPIELNYQQFYAYLEHAFAPRLSLFGELPFRAIQPHGWIDFGPDYQPFDESVGHRRCPFRHEGVSL